MKTHLSYLPVFAVLALAPLALNAADEPRPGKASDGVKETAIKPDNKAPAANNPANDPSKDPGKASDAVTPPKGSSNKFHGKITALDESAKTVTVDDPKMGKHTVHIGTTTKLKKGKEAASWTDLKVGEQVHGVCVKDGEQFHAERLVIGGE